MTDEPTAREVLIALNGHVNTCALFQRISLGFQGAIILALIGFAGYSYAQVQQMQQQQIQTAQTALAAIHQTATEASDETVQKLTTPKPPSP